MVCHIGGGLYFVSLCAYLFCFVCELMCNLLPYSPGDGVRVRVLAPLFGAFVTLGSYLTFLNSALPLVIGDDINTGIIRLIC
jgi:hypothetical protein